MEETTITAYTHFLYRNQLRDTRQRRLIFETFIEQNKHFTAEGLYNNLKKQLPRIGQATVYRTLKLLCKNGLARELNLRDIHQGAYTQSSFFEPVGKQRPLHDHLVCISCGQYFEFHNEKLERLQNEIAAANKFQLESHNLILYGKCHNCYA